jgi:hypothetical protein
VINHGRLVTHSPLEALTSDTTQNVRVRSPQYEELSGVLIVADCAASLTMPARSVGASARARMDRDSPSEGNAR